MADYVPVARIGDPIDHGGHIIEGSSCVFNQGIAVARVTDHVMCDLHGLQTIVTGSPTVNVAKTPSAGYQACARLGSICSCGAVVLGQSPNFKVP